MDPAGLAREYVMFGLAVGRLFPDLVDSYVGPAHLRRQVQAEPPVGLAELAARGRWLATELDRLAGDLGAQRHGFLDRQLAAVRCAVRRASGAPMSYRAEMAAYFDTEVTVGDPDRYREAHRELADLLPGRDPLAARLAAFRVRGLLPPGTVAPAAQRLVGALGELARARFGLPATEEVYLEVLRDQPWTALHRYLGGGRSRVALNTDARVGAGQLARLMAHETYPGHHCEFLAAERAVREPAGSGAPELERALFLLNTPQCLFSEGQADLGLDVLVGSDHADWAVSALAGLVAGLPPGATELTDRVDRLVRTLLPVRQDAALLAHDRGQPPEVVGAYLRRWLLVDDAEVDRLLRFLAHPRWRAYTTSYVEGVRLVRRWLAAGSDESGDGGRAMLITDRYRMLWERPRSPSSVRAELAPAGGDELCELTNTSTVSNKKRLK